MSTLTLNPYLRYSVVSGSKFSKSTIEIKSGTIANNFVLFLVALS